MEVVISRTLPNMEETLKRMQTLTREIDNFAKYDHVECIPFTCQELKQELNQCYNHFEALHQWVKDLNDCLKRENQYPRPAISPLVTHLLFRIPIIKD